MAHFGSDVVSSENIGDAVGLVNEILAHLHRSVISGMQELPPSTPEVVPSSLHPGLDDETPQLPPEFGRAAMEERILGDCRESLTITIQNISTCIAKPTYT